MLGTFLPSYSDNKSIYFKQWWEYDTSDDRFQDSLYRWVPAEHALSPSNQTQYGVTNLEFDAGNDPMHTYSVCTINRTVFINKFVYTTGTGTDYYLTIKSNSGISTNRTLIVPTYQDCCHELMFYRTSQVINAGIFTQNITWLDQFNNAVLVIPWSTFDTMFGPGFGGLFARSYVPSGGTGFSFACSVIRGSNNHSLRIFIRNAAGVNSQITINPSDFVDTSDASCTVFSPYSFKFKRIYFTYPSSGGWSAGAAIGYADFSSNIDSPTVGICTIPSKIPNLFSRAKFNLPMHNGSPMIFYEDGRIYHTINGTDFVLLMNVAPLLGASFSKLSQVCSDNRNIFVIYYQTNAKYRFAQITPAGLIFQTPSDGSFIASGATNPWDGGEDEAAYYSITIGTGIFS